MDAKFSSNLALFLVPRQLVSDSLLLTSLITQFLEFFLQLDHRLILLLFERLILLFFSIKSDLYILKLFNEFWSLVLHNFKLIIEGFFVLICSLLLKWDLLLSNSVSFLHLNFFRFIGDHTIPEIINGFAQVLDDLVLVGLFFLEAKKFLICSFDVHSFFLTP